VERHFPSQHLSDISCPGVEGLGLAQSRRRSEFCFQLADSELSGILLKLWLKLMLLLTSSALLILCSSRSISIEKRQIHKTASLWKVQYKLSLVSMMAQSIVGPFRRRLDES
jgi:hypothetical protein